MSVTVKFSADTEEADLAEMTVRQVRETYAPLFNVPHNAKVLVNKVEVDEKEEDKKTVKDGDVVEFTKKTEKQL